MNGAVDFSSGFCTNRKHRPLGPGIKKMFRKLFVICGVHNMKLESELEICSYHNSADHRSYACLEVEFSWFKKLHEKSILKQSREV